jgi:hypothetical protein
MQKIAQMKKRKEGANVFPGKNGPKSPYYKEKNFKVVIVREYIPTSEQNRRNPKIFYLPL